MCWEVSMVEVFFWTIAAISFVFMVNSFFFLVGVWRRWCIATDVLWAIEIALYVLVLAVTILAGLMAYSL